MSKSTHTNKILTKYSIKKCHCCVNNYTGISLMKTKTNLTMQEVYYRSKSCRKYRFSYKIKNPVFNLLKCCVQNMNRLAISIKLDLRQCPFLYDMLEAF